MKAIINIKINIKTLLCFWSVLCVLALVAKAQSGALSGATIDKPSPKAPFRNALVSVSISPNTASVSLSKSLQLTATFSNATIRSMTWSMSPKTGAGTISQSGKYTAPTVLPSNTTVTISATSQQNKTLAASATVTITSNESLSVSPQKPSLNLGGKQQFKATVSGSSTNTTVYWSAASGKIDPSSGLYTAPENLPAHGTDTVTATSNADPSKKGTATITITSNESVSVSPQNQTLNTGAQQTFTATVSGSSTNTAVTWSAASGSVGASSGLYTAPANVPAGGTDTVTATSNADPTKKGTATITITSNVNVSVNPQSTTVNTGTQQPFTATVSGSVANTAVTWSAASGKINPSSGLYTAPANVPASGVDTVTATSQADPTVKGFAKVTITANPNSTLSIATNGLYLAYIQQPYAAVLTALSGTPPYAWSLSSEALPLGLSLDPASGGISGTPTQGGQYSVTITVTDSGGASATKTLNLQVFEQPTDKYGGLTNKPCSNGTALHFYTQKMGNHWYLCTPAGNAFWVNGVYNTNADQETDYQGIDYYALVGSKYATGRTTDGLLNWSLAANQRLESWGFNTHVEAGYIYVLPTTTASQWGTSDNTIPIHMPFIPQVMPTMRSSYNESGYAPAPTKNTMASYKLSVFGGYMAGAADVFDTNFAAWLAGYLANDPGVKSWYSGPNNDYLIGFEGDESDDTGGFRAGSDFQTVGDGAYVTGKADPHWGWITLITTPVKAAVAQNNTPKQRSPSDIVFADTQFYSKTELSNWLQQTGDNGPGYTSIAALNAAWGSNYDSFGSDATNYKGQACATGNGTTGPYTCTLAYAPVSPLTVQIFVGGMLTAGDDGAGPLATSPTGTGNFRQSGQTSPLGSITYATGAISISFTAPVPVGTQITVNYRVGGWGRGHGLLDEDGTCPAAYTSNCWVPSDAYLLAGGTTAFKTDMNNFLYHFTRQYASIEKSAINAVAPGVLYLGPDVIGSWGAPPRGPVLQAFSQYVDVMEISTVPNTNPFGTITDDQARIDFIAQYAGDKPWYNWQGYWAQADSYMSVYPDPTPMFATQAARGAYYQTYMTEILNVTVSSGCNCSSVGTYPIIGLSWWDYADEQEEKANWGLVTLRDDPYDGVSSTTSQGYDSWGYPTGCLANYGCEQASYGDFIDYVTNANLGALRALVQ